MENGKNIMFNKHTGRNYLIFAPNVFVDVKLIAV